MASGTARLYEPVACSATAPPSPGRMTANALTLEIRGISMIARGILPRRTD